VASCSNIYGVKVLSDSGVGSTSNTIAGLEAIKARHISSPGSKTVVSMSLGGSCAYEKCVRDFLIVKVDNNIL
jgi:subtilisin family serine protease